MNLIIYFTRLSLLRSSSFHPVPWRKLLRFLTGVFLRISILKRRLLPVRLKSLSCLTGPGILSRNRACLQYIFRQRLLCCPMPPAGFTPNWNNQAGPLLQHSSGHPPLGLKKLSSPRVSCHTSPQMFKNII